MEKLDYIVVGLGIAGLTFCEQLEKNNKSFIVYDGGTVSSTLVSAGVLNPVVLKRFTPVWNAKDHIETSRLFYTSISKKLDTSLLQEMSMLRIFKSIEEQNNWMVASDKIELSSFLIPEIIKNKNSYINASFGFGKVNKSARIDPFVLINSYKKHLQNNNQFINENFDYTLLQEVDNQMFYKGVCARKIVFAEGVFAKDNPFFPKETPIRKEKLIIPNKGEYIIIKAPALNLTEMLKSSLFVIPLGNNTYKVGATYDREDTSFEITKNAKSNLVTKLTKIINCSFEVIDQVAGIRPTTRDRRPFLGTLKESDTKIFFNGLGTHGITSAPSLAIKLYNSIENGIALPKEIDIKRHYKW